MAEFFYDYVLPLLIMVLQSVLLLVVLLIAIALDALTHVPRQNPTLPASVLAPGLWELSNKMPAPGHGEGRVMISPRAEAHLLLSRVPSLSDDLLGKRLALW